jgi:hypothetical protein
MSFYNVINCEMYRIAAMHREAKKRLNATAYFYACAPDILFSCFSTVLFLDIIHTVLHIIEGHVLTPSVH